MRNAVGSLSFSSTDIGQTVSITSRLLSNHRLIVADSSAFGARLSRTEIGRISFNRLFYGTELEVQADGMGEDIFLMEVPLSGRSVTRCGGREVQSSRSVGCIMAPSRPFSTTWSADCSKLLVTIDRARAENQLSLLLGRSLSKPLAFEMDVMLSAQSSQTMLSLIDVIARDGRPTHATHAILDDALETAFLSALLLSQPHNYSDMIRPCSCSAVAPWYVRRAEDFIDRNFHTPITLAQIAGSVGVSERTLQTGFQKFRGSSPMEHVRDIRMDRAKRMVEAPGGRVTVGELARAVGYGDAGKFAQAYRKRFGLSPREALYRAS